MLYFLIVTAVIVLAVAIVLFSKIKIFVEYKKLPSEKLYTDIKIKLGFITLKIPKKSKAKKISGQQEEKLTQKLKKHIQTLKIVKKVYEKHRYRIRKNLIVDNFDFHIKFGTGDAASTGILTGILWSFLYGINGLVSTVGVLKKHYFEVVPVYAEKGLILQSSIRVYARVGSLIVLALRLYRTYKKITDTSEFKNSVSEKL